MTKLRQRGRTAGRVEKYARQAAVTRHLRDAEDAVPRRQVARVVAVRLQPVRVLAAEAEARLVDHGGREHVRMARRQSVDAHLLVTFGEPAAVTVALERRRPDLVIVREAVAREKAIVAAEVVIHTHIECMRVVGVVSVDDVVVVQSGLVRRRVQLHQLQRSRIDPRHGNPVAGKRVTNEAGLRRDQAGSRINLASLNLPRGGWIEDGPARERASEDVGADRAAL